MSRSDGGLGGAQNSSWLGTRAGLRKTSSNSSPGMRSDENRSVAVHHRRNGGIEGVVNAEIGRELLYARVIVKFAVISTLAIVTRKPWSRRNG